jgi:uncharacterized protein
LRADVRDQLQLVKAPTLVVGCILDHLVPVENARALHAAIPGSSYAELDSGHVVSAEKPDELVGLLRSFLFDEPSGRLEPAADPTTVSTRQDGDMDQTLARNVALVRRFYERVYAGDIDAVLAMLHKDFTWIVGTESPALATAIPWAGRLLRGREGFLELVTTLFGEFESQEFEAQEFHPVGGHVFVQGRFEFRHYKTGKSAAGDWLARFDISGDEILGGQFFENTFAVAAARS